MENQDELQNQLHKLIIEHRNLDDVIHQLLDEEPRNSLQIQRLKKRKLILKDQITRFKNYVLPNIIA
jgi:hypothetical protein